MRRSILLIGSLAAIGCKDPAPTTGTLVVDISGLPVDAKALVRITGPESFFRTLTSTTTLEDLTPGDYIVRVDTIMHGSTRFGAAVTRDTVQVERGSTKTATIPYNISSGSLDLTINGLPTGTPAGVIVFNNQFSATISNSGVIPGLVPGKYYVRSDTFTTVLGDRFAAATILDSVNVPASVTAATAGVSYTMISATLALTVSGLPSDLTQAPITITGPDSYSAKFAASSTIHGLRPGSYAVTAAQTANGTCPAIYRTTFAPQSVSIAMGETGAITVPYTAGTVDPADLNLKIDAVHVIQVTQNAAWSVPMIAGRPALVRVIGVANQCNTVSPMVRLTIGNAAPVVITAPENFVRLQRAEGTLTSTWNYVVPANLVQSPMSIVAEMDYNGAVAESNEADNRYPSSGARTVQVQAMPTVPVRFVPISQTVNGALQTGAIAGKTDEFMDWAKRIYPVSNWNVDVREPFTTTALLSSGISAWLKVVGELDQLHALDSAAQKPGFRAYYYGVAKVVYPPGSGFVVVGIAEDAPSRTALGRDEPGEFSETMAHEMGHMFGRYHAPCGGAGGPDAQYPYPGGGIGVFGYDATTSALKDPSVYKDIMGYCTNQWISDYTYTGVMNHLVSVASTLSASGNAQTRQRSLLIWGRIDSGVPILEPAFEVDAIPEMPTGTGQNRITATDASGAEILSFSFNGRRVADVPGDNELFSFVVPLSALRGRSVETLRLSARGRTATSVASAVVDSDPGVVATRPGAGRMRLQWNAARFPVLMVRNRATGNVIAFARGGDATITTTADEVDVNASNRVRSARRTVRVLK